jgi:uncharacterized protein YggE
MAATGTEGNLPPSIAVTGTGKVSAKPDLAMITMGVTMEAPTAKAALAANTKAMTDLMAAVKQHGIADRDVQTSNFTIYPQYSNSPGERRPHITSYRVDNQVRVRVRNLAGLGDLLDVVVQNGANNMNGISFQIDNPEPLLDKARVDAVNDARRKAMLYAQAAGVKLGRVLYISESGGYVPPQPRMMTNSFAGASAAVPVEAGENEMQSTINVVYALE